jgi:uncharacterized protein (DUF305 family)
MQKTLIYSLLIVLFISGVGVGYTLTPQYFAYETTPNHEGLGKPDKYLNLRFINGTIAHHMSAIYMLEQVKKESKRKEVLDLADVVIAKDTQGIKELYALKVKLYGDDRIVKKFDKVELSSYDQNFDLRFLNAMIVHHEEAISSSFEARGKSSDKDILVLADIIIQELSENKTVLEGWRSDWYNIK